MSLTVTVKPVTAFMQNTSLLVCKSTNKAALIDPGGDVDTLIALVEQTGCELESILLTHGHLDHVGATSALKAHFNVPVVGPHIGDKFWLDALPKQSEMFNFPHCDAFAPDRWLDHNDSVKVGETELNVRFTPGHTPGHVVFVDNTNQNVFVGDVLFQGSVGRTDFPGGNAQQLQVSIKEQLYSLPDGFTVYPGHGPTTTIGYEKVHNPFTSGRFG